MTVAGNSSQPAQVQYTFAKILVCVRVYLFVSKSATTARAGRKKRRTLQLDKWSCVRIVIRYLHTVVTKALIAVTEASAGTGAAANNKNAQK